MNQPIDDDQQTGLDALNAACLAAPGEVAPQIALWRAVAALDGWVFINRGTAESPRPSALASGPGQMLCIFSSASRAQATALSSGLVQPGEPVPLFEVPLPAAIDWALSFGQYGIVGVTIDYPQLGAWCPLANLAGLRPPREG